MYETVKKRERASEWSDSIWEKESIEYIRHRLYFKSITCLILTEKFHVLSMHNTYFKYVVQKEISLKLQLTNMLTKYDTYLYPCKWREQEQQKQQQKTKSDV